MRIRIHPDVAKLVNKGRKDGKRSANQEVNIALTAYYMMKSSQTEHIDHLCLHREAVKNMIGPRAAKKVLKK